MFPYEKLEVYKKAFDLNHKVYHFLKVKNKIPSYLKTQLGRASLSILLNIAEGSGRFSNRDRRNFYITARSSAFECAALIQFLHSEGELTEPGKVQLNAAFEEISRMLYTMIRNLEKTK